MLGGGEGWASSVRVEHLLAEEMSLKVTATVGTKRERWLDLEGHSYIVHLDVGTEVEELDADCWLLDEEVASSVGSHASGVVVKHLSHPHAISLSVDQLLSKLDVGLVIGIVGFAVAPLREALAVFDEIFDHVVRVDHAMFQKDGLEPRQLDGNMPSPPSGYYAGSTVSTRLRPYP
jgi:hypothetical protein